MSQFSAIEHPAIRNSQTCECDFFRVSVIIPALNEQEGLRRVLPDLPDVRSVIVVDNGSTDNTAQVARDCGAIVVAEPVRGYGSACLAGMAELANQIHPADIDSCVIAFLDADYSDHPEEIAKLVAPILNGNVDLVIGSRVIGERQANAMTPHSLAGTRFACWLLGWVTGHRFTDLGPFRAIRYRSLLDLQMQDRGMGWTIEMQIKAVRQGLRIQEIRVSYRARIGKSKISGTITGSIRAGSKILYLIAKYAFRGRKRS